MAAAPLLLSFCSHGRTTPTDNDYNTAPFHFSKFICIKAGEKHTTKNHEYFFAAYFPPISDSTRQEQTSRRRHPSAGTSLPQQGALRDCSDSQESSQACAQQARGKGELGTAGSLFCCFFRPLLSARGAWNQNNQVNLRGSSRDKLCGRSCERELGPREISALCWEERKGESHGASTAGGVVPGCCHASDGR